LADFFQKFNALTIRPRRTREDSGATNLHDELKLLKGRPGVSSFSFKTIDVPAAAGTYTYIGVSGLDASGDAVGYYGNVDGDGDGTFHGFIALVNGNGITLDPPGSTNTSVGITASGVIFGDYTYLNHQYGFVDNGGVFTTFDNGIAEAAPPTVPLAVSTDVDGITSAGVIYGDYADYVINNGSQPGWQGFLNNNGVVTSIAFPGANITTLAGINAAGTIVGNYEIGGNTNAGWIGHGFVDSNGSFTAIDVPGAYATSVVGISDGGEIVGNYQDNSNNTLGFVDNNGVITKINIAGATSTGVSAVNAAGEIVGYYADSGGNIHGFVDNGGVITTVDVPGATETDILGINAAGVISGYYNDSSYNQHGFVGTPAPTVVDDGPLSILAGTTQTITSNLLSATDNVSSGAQLHFTVTTAPADGTLLLNGTATTSFTQADINNGLVSYHETVGGSATSDNFHFTITDAAGNTTGAESFQISIEQPPMVTIPSVNVSASAGEVFAASSLFSVSDPSGGLLTYFLYDGTANGGHFAVNGVVEPAQTVVALSAAQVAQTTFVAGPAGSSDALAVMAYDGQAYSGNTSFSHLDVNVPSIEQPPVVTIPSANVSASAGEVFAASSLFSVSDPSGGLLTYFLYDGTANGGHFVVNGVVEPAQTVVALSAAQVAQTTFVAGAAGSSDALAVMAYDGQAYSGNTSFSHLDVNVPSIEQPPVVTIPSANVSASAGEVFAASSLFSVSDPSGGLLTYFLYDANSGPAAGHFVVNGVAEPDQTVFALDAAQVAQTTFVAGSAGGSDLLDVMVFDGQAYSGNTSFSPLHVNVTLPTSPASPNTPAVAGDNFVFASSADSTVANLIQDSARVNQTFQAAPPVDHVSTVTAIGDPASVEAMHPNATVDPLALFGMHSAGHAAGHFFF
jgi:Cadherin-like